MADQARDRELGEPLDPSTTFIERIRQHDNRAWTQLADIYGPLIYTWCRVSGVGPNEGADISQEVFLGALQRISEFHDNRDTLSLRCWLWTITRNKIADHFRKKSQDVHAQGGTDVYPALAQLPESPPKNLSPRDPDRNLAAKSCVIDAVRAEFEPHTWAAFWRLTVDEQPAREVAEELGMSPKAVYQAKYRVQRRLRLGLQAFSE